MIDKFSQALALMREAFEDAQTGAGFMPPVDLAAEVDGAQQVINAASAVQVLRVAQYACRDEEQDGSGAWVDTNHGLGHVSEFASDCFGPMLAMGPVAAARKVAAAAILASKLPVTLAAMSAGDLDSWRATIIATELSDACAQSCAAVEALIHPAVLGEAPGAVTKRVRRVLGRVDADALRVKAAKERLDRFIYAYPSHVPGLTSWAASLPAAESAACWAAIDELAHQMHGDDPGRTLEQCRADAAFRPTNPQAGTTNPLLIEPTWQQICAMGYEIPGIGVIGGDVVAAILDRFDTRIARVLLDERTGVVIETGATTYLPNQPMRRFITQRDGHCRFPGCMRAATRCEPDHVIAYSRGGPTTPCNLASLCRHHHRVKHQARWALTMTREGTCTWTDPFGRQYETHPINHHEMAA